MEEMSFMLEVNEVFSSAKKTSVAFQLVWQLRIIKVHAEHRVSFPDQAWLVADRHKLISSVYAGIHIMPDCFGNKEVVG